MFITNWIYFTIFLTCEKQWFIYFFLSTNENFTIDPVDGKSLEIKGLVYISKVTESFL